VAGIGVVACAECQTVDWWDAGGLVEPTAALQRLFGDLELEGTLAALAAPAPEVLVYLTGGRKARRVLEVFPRRVWLRAHPGLWMSHDGERLLLAPVDGDLVSKLGA
jgi:hypothetical protein